ncbi:MAG: stage V sporulation protein AA [Lachnospiraceae bacterium]|nr:stage V sporulation protein AA [Lachnospiraceae bacterium]
MKDNIYINVNQTAKVHTENVYLKDVATVTCTDKNAVNRLLSMKIMTFAAKSQNRYIFSTLKIIEHINEIYPDAPVNSIGENQFIIEYEPPKKKIIIWEYAKVTFICILLFFGAGFTIMSFNNEICIQQLFLYIYHWITGETSGGFTLLEIGYSIGIFLGITIFYNHLGKKKISNDPTPAEIEIRKYETDISKTLIDGIKRKDSHIDVN